MTIMYRGEILKRLKQRISSCYADLMYNKNNNLSIEYREGFRCRLDELLLLYQLIQDITFVEACKELEVSYEDVNCVYAKGGEQ